ncbi:DNA-processing protein DprA [Nemorincola caseinilytica]|uniref:DNA-processing protein DprA n=1 Tax=Nemorincola caseinilytica TaxID=2054315 RepID=A0ABP8NH83_9BACT
MHPATENEELFYLLALSFIPGVGVRTGRALLARFGSAKAVFSAPLKELTTIDGVSDARAKAFREPDILQKAGAELDFILKNNVKVYSIEAEGYPTRLAACADAPLLLFCKGTARPEAKKTVAIVGTRKNTDYGQKLCEELVDGLRQLDDLLVVSGLALGIDAIAHKKCVQAGIPTIGVLGHGVDTIYPPSNKNLAAQMMENGGILSEFPSGTALDRGNFPMRNRIVAGMCDVTVIVESHASGGALITASLAAGYNREVAAFPGRVTDSRSAGCNALIRSNMAAMITNTEDLLQLMNWDGQMKARAVQPQLFLHLTPEEQKIVDLLQARENAHVDELSYHTGMPTAMLAGTLLQLELQGVIKALPGKYYRIY